MQALPKGERAELAVETMTELGVDEIVPWAAARCVAQWHGPRGDKALASLAAHRVAGGQAEPSRLGARRSRTSPTLDRVDRVPARRAARAARGRRPSPLAAAPLPLVGDVVLVVGPEGGVATRGARPASARPGRRPVRLGDPVLRTSTAGAAALAALSVRLGRWT